LFTPFFAFSAFQMLGFSGGPKRRPLPAVVTLLLIQALTR
jgi:hypothetical protein